jgi:hypothetical protein
MFHEHVSILDRDKTGAEMIGRYTHLAPENIRKAVAVLEDLSRFGHIAQEKGLEKHG